MYHEDDQYDQLATPADACREYALNVGRDQAAAGDRDTEWILTPWDTWEKNPFYQGEPGPHPEDFLAGEV